jgi:nitrite reductase/ring-hydroxylating ferredoxin subunit
MSLDVSPAPVAETIDLRLDDLPVGSLRLVRVVGRKLCLVRTSEGLSALDHACPHEGYGLTQ